MNEDVTDTMEVGELVAEISRLRAQVARLQERVESLDELAHQDHLVAMPNRRGFERELERLIARVGRYGSKSAMLYVDVDGLKIINDTFGHSAGDQALIQIATLLAKGLRRSDVVARIGGDEFGALLENADQAKAEETAQRLCDAIAAAEFTHDGDPLPLGVAIGVAAIEADDRIVDVMHRADEDMYRRKAAA